MKFIDALYGTIDLDIEPAVLSLPELQRLREVRLCNVNSPFITGGSNLNRFEHAIGTAYLSKIFCKKNNIKPNKKEFFIASLIHDIVTGPFGHSLEYLFEALKKTEYEHAQLDTIFKGKTVQASRSYFMNKKSMLIKKNDLFEIKTVRDILLGRHNLSKYIANNIDLDNIDNVFRFAYHIGIKFNTGTPEELARQLTYKDNQLLITEKNGPLFEEWYNTRKRLYKLLLEEPGEFVAKALLERTFIELIKEDTINEIDWILVDFDLVKTALTKGNNLSKECIQRYMLMDFPAVTEIFYINNFQKLDSILQKEKLNLIEKAFENGVFLHFIRDVNKTQRPIVGINNNNQSVTIGKKNDRYLIGLFSETKKYISIVKSEIEKTLDERLMDINHEPSLF